MAHSKVQSVLFHRKYWDVKRSRKWLNEKGFKSSKVDIKPNGKYIRYRQFKPNNHKQHIIKDNPKYKSIKFLLEF